MSRTKNTIRIHSKMACSRANGPGLRAVFWMQGCPFICPKCFNENLRDPKAGKNICSNELFSWLTSVKNISGVSISGGEPTEQTPELLPILRKIKNETNLSILLFSGRTLEQITSQKEGAELISLLDVLIDGQYNPTIKNPPGIWPSSTNQKIHFLTNRYSMNDFHNLPAHEIYINEDGDVIESGIWNLQS